MSIRKLVQEHRDGATAASQPAGSLVAGVDIISKLLRRVGSPMGLMFEFRPMAGGLKRQQEPQQEQDRPPTARVQDGVQYRLVCLCPRSYAAILASLAPLFMYLAMPQWGFRAILEESTGGLPKIGLFAGTMVHTLEVSAVATLCALWVLTVHEQPRLGAMLAAPRHLVGAQFQRQQARICIGVFAYKSLAFNISVVAVMSAIKSSPGFKMYILFMQYVFLINLYAPTMYSCFLARALGEHVRNFTRIHVDSLFEKALVDFSNHPMVVAGAHQPPSCSSETHKRGSLLAILTGRKYGALAGQQRADQLSRARLNMGERARQANNATVRNRVALTQAMLLEVRDMATTIGRTSSPFLLVVAGFELVSTIFVVSASVYGHTYDTLNLLNVPPLLIASSFALGSYYVCTSLDDASHEARKTINKLFDFIIFNTRPSKAARTWRDTKHETMLDHTWAQFQYLRRLSETIKFYCGGVLPVTRRLVLVSMGYMLSYTFVSIELMHMVDL